jgi:hypothetical protein
VIANDMVVEDLIENRLEALTRSLALKEIAPRPEPVVEANKNPETEVQEATIELSEEASPEASAEATEELSFEPISEIDEQVKTDDGEAEDVHS